ncbi:FH2 domain-containing protein 1-like protein, partial [Lates japonicus]
VSILDAKRGMNVGIFLKQFKRSNQMIVDDIRHGNSEPYGVEPLRELLKLLPETEEVKKLKSYRGDVSKLSLADSFIYLLIQLPSYTVRIESMLLKEEFPGVCEAMKTDIRILRSATKELMYRGAPMPSPPGAAGWKYPQRFCKPRSLCSLSAGSRGSWRKEGSELIDFFCEDRDARPDDCFSIFHTFCSRFTNAVKEKHGEGGYMPGHGRLQEWRRRGNSGQGEEARGST